MTPVSQEGSEGREETQADMTAVAPSLSFLTAMRPRCPVACAQDEASW